MLRYRRQQINSLVIYKKTGAMEFVMIGPLSFLNAHAHLLPETLGRAPSAGDPNGPIITKLGLDELVTCRPSIRA
jgi:hypothetical protein